LLPGAALALRHMRTLGAGLIVVSNQSGIGRGYFDRAVVDQVHARLKELLAAEGVTLDGVYVCPHTPEDACNCRKPKPGLLLQSAVEHGFEPASCFVVGDKACDIELGRAVGATTILVRTGYGAEHLESGEAKPDLVAKDLPAAAAMLESILAGPPQADGAADLRPDAAERLRRQLVGSISTKRDVMEYCQREILAAAALLVARLRAGSKVLLCGNGGSAADCQHIAAELVSLLTQTFPRPGLPAIALTTDSSFLTASANDFGFDGIFERQTQALGRPGDVLIGISTSGNSENVVRALRYASANGIHTISFSGAARGRVTQSSEVAIRVPSACTQHIQESHIAIAHILCDLVERTLFAPS
jgi:D-sedoheptulose 7-phosphate isomerase